MSFSTISMIALDTEFRMRVTSAVVQQDFAIEPEDWVYRRRWDFANLPGWAAQVESWMAGNGGATNGWQSNPAVISDAEITAGVANLREVLRQR